MAENSSIIERYENKYSYKESGTFYSGFPAEYALFAAAVVVMILGAVFLDIKILEPAQYQTEYALLMALASLIVCSVWIAVWAIAAKMFMTGYKCSYECDEEKFTTTVLGKTRTIYYKEVVRVSYEGMSLFGKTRGYIVTVYTLNKPIRYRIVYANSRVTPPPKGTIFHIIEERTEHIKQQLSPAPIPVMTRFDETIKTQERYSKAELTGAVFPVGKQPEEAVMPSIELSARGAVERLNAELMGACEEKPAAKLSPVVENIRSEEAQRNLLIETGSLFFSMKHEGAVMAVIFAAAVGGAVFLFAGFILSFIDVIPKVFGLLYNEITIAVAAVLIVLALTVLNVIKEGVRYTYKATGEEFRIFDRKGREVISFFYGDVLRVEYSGIKLLWRDRGYKVKITTKYREITYRWLFPRNTRWVPPEKTPFNLIAERISQNRQLL